MAGSFGYGAHRRLPCRSLNNHILLSTSDDNRKAMVNSKTRGLPESDATRAQGRHIVWLDFPVMANAWFVFDI